MNHLKRWHILYVGAFIVGACYIVLCSGCSALRSDPYRSVCQIRVSGGQGSGTLIGVADNQGLVLTARHVAVRIDATATLDWFYAGNQHTTGVVAAISPGDTLATDMALVVCSLPDDVAPLSVARFDPNNGPWRCFGFKGDVPWETVALGAREHDGIIELDQPFTQGMSGGPVLDRDDNVVGIVVASDMESIGIASDGKTLAVLVAAHLR